MYVTKSLEHDFAWHGRRVYWTRLCGPWGNWAEAAITTAGDKSRHKIGRNGAIWRMNVNGWGTEVDTSIYLRQGDDE